MIRPFLFLLVVLGFALPPAHKSAGSVAEIAFQAQLLANLCGSATPALPSKSAGCPACILHSGAPLPGPVTRAAAPKTRIVLCLGPCNHARSTPSQPSVRLPPSRGPPHALS